MDTSLQPNRYTCGGQWDVWRSSDRGFSRMRKVCGHLVSCRMTNAHGLDEACAPIGVRWSIGMRACPRWFFWDYVDTRVCTGQYLSIVGMCFSELNVWVSNLKRTPQNRNKLFFDRHGAQNSSKHAFANDTAHPAYPLCCMYKIIRICLFLRINRKTKPRRRWRRQRPRYVHMKSMSLTGAWGDALSSTSCFYAIWAVLLTLVAVQVHQV